MRTLCLPITKETLLLQGLTKLDQLVSSMMYSPFRAQKRMDECSKGCPAYWRTAEKTVKTKSRCQQFFQAYTGDSRSWSGKLCALTLSVNTQHDWSVMGMQVEQNGRTDQVLGEIPKEGNRPDMKK